MSSFLKMIRKPFRIIKQLDNGLSHGEDVQLFSRQQQRRNG
jgi:hypothetical protein